MKLLNLAPRGEIGGSCYVLEVGSSRIVLDCGTHPKMDGLQGLPDFGALEYDSVDAIIITHAHLDHVGSLPVLMRSQPSAEVISTPFTAELVVAMLHNSVSVMEAKREELDLKEYPLFSHREITISKKRWLLCQPGKIFRVGDNEIQCEFFESGHIVGAVGVRITHEGKSFFYTSDVQFEGQTIAKPADFPESNVDVLMIETTRGAYERCPKYTREGEIERLAEEIRATFARGGSVLIPVFAMGKTQELLVMLNQLKYEDRIPFKTPIYIGGLSTKMTLIYDRHADQVRRNFPDFRILEDMEVNVASKKRRKDITYQPGCIYALSSGMMNENTVSNKFSRWILSNPANSILFVGYADPESPAGKLRATERGEFVEINREDGPQRVNCKVDVFDFSGHADRESIRQYINRLNPETVLLVHGETKAVEWFQENLKQDLPNTRIVAPEKGSTIELSGD